MIKFLLGMVSSLKYWKTIFNHKWKDHTKTTSQLTKLLLVIFSYGSFLWISGTKNELVEEFLKSNTAEKQLALMKNILNTSRDSFDDDIIRFLALVFLQAETKHPVKCFLTR